MAAEVKRGPFMSLFLCLLPQRGEHGTAADHRSGQFRSAAAVHTLPQRPQDGAVGRVGGAEPSLDPHASQSHARHWWAFTDSNFTLQSKQPVCLLNFFFFSLLSVDFFTGSDSIHGTWCKDILQTIMTFTPHNWASHTLSCFPAPLQVHCFQ